MKYFLVLALSLITLCTSSEPLLAASTYGRDGYNTCDYSRDCPTTDIEEATPPPVPNTPETPKKDNTSIVVTISNIKPNQVISQDNVNVIVRIEQLLNDGTSAPIPIENVGWVALYVDDKRVTVQYNQSGDGIYSLPWDLTKFPGTKLAVVLYDRQGNILKRKDLVVAIAQRFFTQPESSAGGNTEEKRFELSGPAVIVVKSFPYWIFLILLIVAIRLWRQSVNEIRATRLITSLIEQELRVGGYAKDFIALVSHYLRTAVTIIDGGLDLVKPQDGITPAALQASKSAVTHLKATIENALASASYTAESGVVEASAIEVPPKPYKTLAFWIPAFGIVIICAVTQLLLNRFTNILYAPADILLEVFAGFAVAVFVLLSIRQRQIKQSERIHVQASLDRQKDLESARTGFIMQTAQTVSPALTALEQAAEPLNGLPNSSFLQKGITNLRQVTNQCSVAVLAVRNNLQIKSTNIGILEYIHGYATALESEIVKKEITIHWPANDTRVYSSDLLFGYVLKAVFENAVVFNAQGGTIDIEITQDEVHTVIDISDSGIGIAAEKLSALFEPFARGTSVEQYDYQGMGFSLFLSKLIMVRLGGDISVQATQNTGTSVRITLPNQPLSQ